MIGYKNEFFEIIESAGRNPKKRYRLWKCLCVCGKTTILDTHSITKKRIKSCGCSRKGINKGNTFGERHGMLTRKRKNPLYQLRNTIMTRCYNAKPSDYPYYQGKGIIVCDEWIQNPKSFEDWAMNNGWQKGLSIDRIDPDGNYEPNNCRFISQSENTNRRHEQGLYKRITKAPQSIVTYCCRCKCTAPEDSECKLKRVENVQYKRK